MKLTQNNKEIAEDNNNLIFDDLEEKIKHLMKKMGQLEKNKKLGRGKAYFNSPSSQSCEHYGM